MGQGELLFLTFFKEMFSGFKKNVHGLVEILTLRLVEGCIVPCYNHLAQGDYSRSAKFRSSCLAFLSAIQGNGRKKTQGFLPYRLKSWSEIISRQQHWEICSPHFLQEVWVLQFKFCRDKLSLPPKLAKKKELWLAETTIKKTELLAFFIILYCYIEIIIVYFFIRHLFFLTVTACAK